MSIEAIIARYGVVAVFAGAGFEGETAAVAGGLLAHQGFFALPAAMVAAAAGSFVADQLFFLLGRRFRTHRWVTALHAKRAFTRAIALLEGYPRAFIFGFRFIYGIRTVSPVAIGTSGVPAQTFVVMNTIAAAVWGALFVGLGYVFGHGIETLLGRVPAKRHVMVLAIAGVVLLVACVQAIRWWRGRATPDDAPLHEAD
ncbi:MAG: DedA family protein [Sphingomonas sp.]